VINQTYGNVEYMVIDGGSTDGTVDVIEKYSPHIDYWISEEDNGIYDAMNKGVLKSTGDYIHFLNSGDTFYDQESVSKVALIIEKNDICIIYGKANFIYRDYNVIKNNSLSSLKLGKGICHQATFVKTHFIKENTFDTKYKSASDFDLLCKISKENKPTYRIQNIIVNYIAGGFSANKYVTYSEIYLILKEHFGRYHAYRFYFLKVILEQGTKKTLLKLGLKELLAKLTKLNNSR